MSYNFLTFTRKHEKVLANVVRTLSYTTVVTSEGGGMNCTDGKFTVPVTGIYFFHFSGIALSSTYLQVRNVDCKFTNAI